MVIYEVNLSVERSIGPAFSRWLSGHVKEILAIDGFLSAEIFERERAESDPPGKLLWTVHYRLRDGRSLRRYLARHAPALRADAIERFGTAYAATRRVLVLRKSVWIERGRKKRFALRSR